MKKKLIFSAMLVCLMVLGLAFVACGDDNGGTGWAQLQDTTWKATDGTEIKFEDMGGPGMSITYSNGLSGGGGQITIDGNKITQGGKSFNFAISGTTMTITDDTIGGGDLNGTYTKQ